MLGNHIHKFINGGIFKVRDVQIIIGTHCLHFQGRRVVQASKTKEYSVAWLDLLFDPEI
jgi:hypothetical protein